MNFTRFNRKICLMLLSFVLPVTAFTCEEARPSRFEDKVWFKPNEEVFVGHKGAVIIGHCRILSGSVVLFRTTEEQPATITFANDARLTVDTNGTLILDGVRLVMDKSGAVLATGTPGRKLLLKVSFKIENILAFLGSFCGYSEFDVSNSKIVYLIEYILRVGKTKIVLCGNTGNTQLELANNEWLVNGFVEVVDKENTGSGSDNQRVWIRDKCSIELGPCSKLKLPPSCVYGDPQ